MVFQDYALFPHLNVNDNVAFGLKMRRLPQSEIAECVASSLEMVNLQGFETRKVTDLSGGEQQRVALARALATRPRLLMFDEPLGALDRTLREDLLNELRPLLTRYRQERRGGERFGDFCARVIWPEAILEENNKK